MTTFDFVIIGAGPAGEAAAFKARSLGASVAIADARWFGGSCPHIGCLPSKALLHAAAEHITGRDYPWSRASAHRDWMVNRAADAMDPDDATHVKSLEDAGAAVYRGRARIIERGRVDVVHDGATHPLEGRHVVVAVGSRSKVPPIEGLAATDPWTNREGTLARELPRSLLVLGGGPTGCELAQVYARFGVPVVIVQSGPRLAPTDHPRNSDMLRATLERDGVVVRTGVRAVRAHAGARADGAHIVDLDDGSSAAGHTILLAVGRDLPVADLGLEHYGLDADARDAGLPRDGRLRLADGLYVAGDPAGPELHTHQAHYQGELVVRLALGENVTPRYRALPRATYTEPEAASVGLTLDEAVAAGLDAVEFTADFATSTKGYSIEATMGHVTVTFDRVTRELVGAAMACPDASAAIHECVLAIRANVPVEVLADTIHAFPSTSRILNGLFAEAAAALAP